MTDAEVWRAWGRAAPEEALGSFNGLIEHGGQLDLPLGSQRGLFDGVKVEIHGDVTIHTEEED